MTEHPADNLQRVAAHLPTFRDPLGPAFRRMEELNASLTRMAEVHNGLGHLAGIEKSIARAARLQTGAQALPKERGLATAPHTDNSHRLALDTGQMDITASMGGYRSG